MPRSRTPKGRPQAGSRHPRNDEHRQSKSLYQSPFSIPYATISLLCHLRESRHPHNNQHSKGFTPTNQARSRTFYRPAPPNQPKNFPVRQPPYQKRRKSSPPTRRLPCREVRGGSGRFGGQGTPSERGSPAPPRSFPKPSPQPPLPWQGVRVLRGWKGFSDAERRGKARRRPS